MNSQPPFNPAGRPLVISDCDEVLLRMVVPFGEWLAETQGITFHMEGHNFVNALRYTHNDVVVPQDEIWRLLGGFFDTEMPRQQPIEGALSAMAHLANHADVVVLTNLEHHRRDARTEQLAGHGLDVRVFTNQGLKGPALRAIVEEYRPSRVVYIDDLPQHIGSVAETLPGVTRLHLCGEPLIAPHIDCAHEAGHAHARIDDWVSALPWIEQRLFAPHLPSSSSPDPEIQP